MAVHFWIHGIPQGQYIWGEDNSYIANRYNDTTTKTPTLFTVEVIGGKTYYTYSKGGNVYASDGRDGSYFAMTVGFDGQYCKDTEGLYDLFSTLFNEKVVGKILKKEQNNYRFLINNFEGQPAVNDIKTQFDKFLTQFPSSDFEKLDNTFTRTNNSISYAISEVNSPQFYEDLRKNGQILISPDYPSKNQQIAQKNAQIQAVQQQCANEINAIKQQYEQSKQQLTQQIQTVQQQWANDKQQYEHSIKKQYENTINDMNNKINYMEKNNKNLQQMVSKSQEDCTRLNEENKKLKEKNEELKEQPLFKLLKINFYAGIILLLTLVFALFKLTFELVALNKISLTKTIITVGCVGVVLTILFIITKKRIK